MSGGRQQLILSRAINSLVRRHFRQTLLSFCSLLSVLIPPFPSEDVGSVQALEVFTSYSLAPFGPASLSLALLRSQNNETGNHSLAPEVFTLLSVDKLLIPGQAAKNCIFLGGHGVLLLHYGRGAHLSTVYQGRQQQRGRTSPILACEVV